MFLENGTKEKINCFVVIPFSDEFAPIWKAIQNCATNLQSEGVYLITNRAVENTKSMELHSNIKKNIRECDILIVDVTGENSNVIFEFGMAIALNKHIVPISQTDNKELSTDYRHYLYLQYEKDELEIFQNQLRSRLLDEIERIHEKDERNRLQKKVIIEKDRFEIECIKDREKANFKEIFKKAQNEIKVIQTNMLTVLEYVESIEYAIKLAEKENRKLEVSFLSLNPESYFAAIRAEQLGSDVAEFRNELHESLFEVYTRFEKNKNVENSSIR